VLGVPHVEIIDVHAHAHEIFGTGFFVETDEVVWIELFSFPRGDDVFVAKLCGVAVVFEVVLILFVALEVKVPRIPVAVFGGGLRAPMGPDAQFGVAEPVRASVSA
jgi:hypothetical protein